VRESVHTTKAQLHTSLGTPVRSEPLEQAPNIGSAGDSKDPGNAHAAQSALRFGSRSRNPADEVARGIACGWRVHQERNDAVRNDRNARVGLTRSSCRTRTPLGVRGAMCCQLPQFFNACLSDQMQRAIVSIAALHAAPPGARRERFESRYRRDFTVDKRNAEHAGIFNLPILPESAGRALRDNGGISAEMPDVFFRSWLRTLCSGEGSFSFAHCSGCSCSGSVSVSNLRFFERCQSTQVTAQSQKVHAST